MNASTRRAKQRVEMRSLILEAAREVFVREGYERVSMRRLADRIDYSAGTIYLHFRSKEDLLNSLVEESFDRLYAALERARRDDPVETLRAGLHAYVDFGLSHPNHYHFAFMLRRGSARKSTSRPHRAFEFLRDTVRRCVKEGRFVPLDIETTAQALWAGVHGITSLLITRPLFPWVPRDRLVEEAIDTSIRGLLAGGPPGDGRAAGRPAPRRLRPRDRRGRRTD